MLEKVAKIFRDYKGNEELLITEQTTFAALELDSLDTVDLIMQIEEAFSVTIDLVDEIKSIGDLIYTIERSQAQEKIS